MCFQKISKNCVMQILFQQTKKSTPCLLIITDEYNHYYLFGPKPFRFLVSPTEYCTDANTLKSFSKFHV